MSEKSISEGKNYIKALQTLYDTTDIEYIDKNDNKYVFFVEEKVIIITKTGENSWNLKTIK